MKVKIGRDLKRNRFDLSHDVNTTSNFGFLQPLMGREMMPNSKMSVKVSSVVRLAPMPCPTYGRVDYRIYHQFVPYSEIFHPFESLLSGQSYSSDVKSYVPNSVPSAPISCLSSFLLLSECSYMTCYKLRDGEENVLDGNGGAYSPISWNSGGSKLTEAWLTFIDKFSFHQDFSTSLTPNTNGPVVTFDSYDYCVISDDGVYLFLIRLTNLGQRLRKIFLGLGYQIDFDNSSSVSLMPIFCYYKAYFDIFYPKDGINWRDTYLFRYIDYLVGNGLHDVLQLSSNSILSFFESFLLKELGNCFYYDNSDFISSHIVSTAINNTSDGLSVVGSSGYVDIHQGDNELPTLDNFPLTRIALLALNKFTKYVNKNTVIGSNIIEFLKSHFGASSFDYEQSNFIGSDVCDIQIGDVMSLAGNPGESLGQFAGKGYGYNQGDFLNFESDKHGIWIVMACIVPHGGYSQGVDYNLRHRTRFDFPTPEFDSLGFQISNKDVVFSQSDLCNVSSLNGYSYHQGESFGFIPRYFEAKVANNVLNGDMSRRSTRDSFLPYTLDRYIKPFDLKVRGVTDDGTLVDVGFSGQDYPVPAAGSSWRNVGQYPWLQNYNRIFNNGSVIPDDQNFEECDNFIIHNYIECYLNQPLMPVSESFDTDGQDDNATTVEHS